jgi:hypothetical protein
MSGAAVHSYPSVCRVCSESRKGKWLYGELEPNTNASGNFVFENYYPEYRT